MVRIISEATIIDDVVVKLPLFTAVDDNNDSVNSFYEKLGFEIERQYMTPEGRRMNEYWITF